jgi:hypothetical protein
MSMFRNRQTGDVTTVFGEVHDAFVTRADEECIFDDRDATRDPLTEYVAPELAAPAITGVALAHNAAAGAGGASPDAAESAPIEPAGKIPAVSQKSTTPDAAGVDNPKE